MNKNARRFGRTVSLSTALALAALFSRALGSRPAPAGAIAPRGSALASSR